MQRCSGHNSQQPHRAQSGPLGVLLVFALVIAATTLIVALGAGAISGSQEQLDAERTEKAMTQLDSQAALVALGSSSSQTVDISAVGSDNYVVDDSAGQMTLSYENQTDGTTTTIFSQELGHIVYEGSDGSTIAYQGGGVWRSDGSGGSVMVSPPEFHYRDATLTLPLVVVNSTGTIDNRAVISQSRATQQFPNTTSDPDFQNPLENARVEVTVQSEYYRAWGQYFETRTQGEVEYDDANEEVTLVLVTPLENTRVTSATASLAASGTFEISGRAANLCGNSRSNYTDSYNSTDTSAGYCGQEAGSNGDVVYGGDVDIDQGSGGSDIRGDVTSGGSVFVKGNGGGGQPYVYGNISYSDNCEPDEDGCEERIRSGSGGSVTQISGIDEAPAINGIIRTQVDGIEATNDNADPPIDSTTQTLDYPTTTTTLTAGDYYLSELTVPGSRTLELDTTSGDITIAVEEDVELGSGATIDVVGDGTVSVYVQGSGGNSEQLEMDESSAITNAGQDAPQFRLFGPDNFTAEVGGGNNNLAEYVGVIYAPPGDGGSGTVTLDGGVVYGGVLTGTTVIENRGSIHYDEALRTEQVLQRSDSIVRVTYIHASTNNVTVEDG